MPSRGIRKTESAALSFGQIEVPFDGVVLVKKVRCENFSNSRRTYSVRAASATRMTKRPAP